jgi:hypothetical protein
MEMELKPVFIFTIVAVAMIGMMVPNIFAGHETFETTLNCKSDIVKSINQELEYPLNLDVVKNNVYEIATDCVKDRLHQISNSCSVVNNEIQILKEIQLLTEITSSVTWEDTIKEKSAELKIAKWTCSEDTLDVEFNITSKFDIAKAKYDSQKLAKEKEYQEALDHNKGRLTWVMDCSEKGKIVINNIKEYSDDGITLKNIESYNYQILDSKFNPIIDEIDHTGENILYHHVYPQAKYVQMYGEQGVYETEEICSNYFEIKFLDVTPMCPTIDDYEVIENTSNDGQKYSFVPRDSAEFGFEVNNYPKPHLLLQGHYSDEQITSHSTSQYTIPVKNDNAVISYVILSSDDYYSQEISYSCEITPFMEKSLVTIYENNKATETKAAETRDYCNEEIDGCRVTYNLRYEIDAPNEFIYKSWVGDDSIDNIENISYTFTKSSKFSFFLRENTHLKHGAGSLYDSATEKFELGSMFIPSKAPITNLISGEGYKIERKNMNFAGMNRDVIHVEYIESIKTLSGFIDYKTKWYYDWSTGLLLKYEFQRTLLDVAGITNHDKMIQEISKVNFPKNNNSGGGCLIATATYGSEMALEVQQLRELRDNTLLNTKSGTAFMGMFNDIYYSFSPTIADMEREHPMFKEAVKLAITPMISTLSLMENAESESEVLSIGLSVIALNLGMYLGVPAVVIIGIRKRF